MRDEAKILSRLIGLAECFERQLSKATQEIYLDTLAGFDDQEIIAAISRAGMECKFFPRPAELIEFIKGPKESPKDIAAIAWSKLVKAIERQGSYKSVIFSDAAIMAAVRALGGWERVCSWELSEINWRQKEFCELYSGIHGVNAPAYLPGRTEKANICAGYAVDSPVLADGDCERKILPMPKSDQEILNKIIKMAAI